MGAKRKAHGEKNMKDLISIIVPVYNKAAYLQPCLDSLQAQIYTDIEVILVDDGSTDASGSICQAMCRSDARFHYLRQENAGQNAARKAGLDIARGTWIIFVDADDTVTDDMCSSMMQRQQETQADMVCSGYADVPGSAGDLATYEIPGVYDGREVIHSLVPRTFEREGMRVFRCGLLPILFHRDVIGPAFERLDMRVTYSEDVIGTLTALLRAKRVAFLRKVVYFYQQHETSFTHSHKSSNVLSQKYLLAYITTEFQQTHIPEEDMEGIAWLVTRTLLVGGYEFFHDYDGLYPFFEGTGAKRIAVYGAGAFGGELVSKFPAGYELAGCFDREYEHLQSEGRAVQAPEAIASCSCDAVVVAIQNPKTAIPLAEKLRAAMKGMPVYTISPQILASAYTKRKLDELQAMKEG